jgi:hypothetical protein
MNAAIHLAKPPLTASVGHSPAAAPIDAVQAEDLYRAWKSVFERAQAVHPADAGKTSSAAGRVQAELAQGVRGSVVQPPASRLDPAPVQEPVSASSTSIASLKSRAVGESVATAADESSHANPEVSAVAITAAATSKARSVAHDVQDSQPVARLASVASFNSAPVSAESVTVLMHGTNVDIVVRDATISEQEAVHCAFETVRRLTGQRAGLHELTLNGRIVYQRRSDSAERVATAQSFLVFVC